MLLGLGFGKKKPPLRWSPLGWSQGCRPGGSGATECPQPGSAAHGHYRYRLTVEVASALIPETPRAMGIWMQGRGLALGSGHPGCTVALLGDVAHRPPLQPSVVSLTGGDVSPYPAYKSSEENHGAARVVMALESIRFIP